MAVSYNYAWKLWKNMRDQVEAEAEAVKETLHNITQGKQQYRKAPNRMRWQRT